jgi:hypothetical protein
MGEFQFSAMARELEERDELAEKKASCHARQAEPAAVGVPTRRKKT